MVRNLREAINSAADVSQQKAALLAAVKQRLADGDRSSWLRESFQARHSAYLGKTPLGDPDLELPGSSWCSEPSANSRVTCKADPEVVRWAEQPLRALSGRANPSRLLTEHAACLEWQPPRCPRASAFRDSSSRGQLQDGTALAWTEFNMSC